MKINEIITEAESYQPPELNVGDKILKGKFKNSPAEIKGFKKDKHNQPVLKTDKGDVQLFKPRLTKLMKENSILEGSERFNGVIEQIKFIDSRFILPAEKEFVDQKQSLKWWLEDNPNSTKEDWAKKMLDKAAPIPVTWDGSDGWDMRIHDGHHRFLACKILGIMPRVTIKATNVPISYIDMLMSEDDGSLKTGGIDNK